MSILSDTLNTVVGRIEVRTAYGPPISIEQPFAAQPTGEDSPTTKLLKPVIAIYPRSTGVISADPIVFAPYGDPGETKWPFIVTGAGLLLGWLAFRAFGRR